MLEADGMSRTAAVAEAAERHKCSTRHVETWVAKLEAACAAPRKLQAALSYPDQTRSKPSPEVKSGFRSLSAPLADAPTIVRTRTEWTMNKPDFTPPEPSLTVDEFCTAERIAAPYLGGRTGPRL